MDKTIEIIVVAAITMIAAAIIAFLLQSETSSFSGFLGNQSDSSKCKLLAEKGQLQGHESQCQQYVDISCSSLGEKECKKPNNDCEWRYPDISRGSSPIGGAEPEKGCYSY
ncbi:MAG: hypothetical protein ABEJ83_03170 [Candidatus Nanohaloarchaea archaeon]